MRWFRLVVLGELVLTFFGIAGCSEKNIEKPEGPMYGIAKIAVPIPKLLQSTIFRVQAVVTAADIDTIRQDLPIGSDNMAQGTIGNILVGDNRKITLNGYRSDGTMTHTGFKDGLTITAVDTLAVEINLLPIVGAVRVNGTIQQTVSGDNSMQVIYAEDFSNTPNWSTNNSANYYQDGADGVYHIHYVAQSEEYAYIIIPYHGESFILEVDMVGDQVEWASQVGLGLYGASLRNYWVDSSAISFELGLGYDDNGPGAGITARDKNGVGGVQRLTNPYEIGIWYHFIVTYDKDKGTIGQRVTRKDTGEEIPSTPEIAVPSGFSSDMVYLGSSTVGHTLYGRREARGRIDNLVFRIVN